MNEHDRLAKRHRLDVLKARIEASNAAVEAMTKPLNALRVTPSQETLAAIKEHMERGADAIREAKLIERALKREEVT